MSKCNPMLMLIALVALGQGCATLGPRMIRTDRFNYNEAGAESAKEQMLLNIVRLRYGEPIYFLEIGSMLSQFRLEAGGTISGFQNNLHGSFGPVLRAANGITNERPTNQTEVGGNLSYSDSPTITYRPLQGEEFSKRIMAPIPPTVVIFLAQSGWSIDRLFGCCVQQVNNIPNQALHDSEVAAQDNREFSRLLFLLKKLQDSGKSCFALESENGAPIMVLYIPETIPGLESELSELRKTLGYANEGKLRLRVTGNAIRLAPDELAIQTRSMLASMYALALECAAPSDHVQDHEVGSERMSANADPDTNWLRIEHSRLPQVDPFVQVHFNGYWFYIAKSDWSSKRTFALLTYLFSLQAADITSAAAPLVTVGTGR